MKKSLHLLSYLLLRLACLILALLPLGFSYGLARVIGTIVWHILGYRRQVTLANLRIAFGPQMSESELAVIGAQSYRQVAMSFIELLLAPKLRKQIDHMLAPEQAALFKDLLRVGRGLVAISGHLGNWELQGAAAATAMNTPFTVAAVQQSNPYINRFITKRRNSMGMRVAGSKPAMKLLLRALRQGEAVGLVADQNAGRDAVFVDFFGKTAATHPGPAQLALKFKAPLLVAAAIRTGPGQFRILVRQVEIAPDDTVTTLTQKHVKILEEFIRQYPEQYYWVHRRWKTRPPEEIEDLKN